MCIAEMFLIIVQKTRPVECRENFWGAAGARRRFTAKMGDVRLEDNRPASRVGANYSTNQSLSL